MRIPSTVKVDKGTYEVSSSVNYECKTVIMTQWGKSYEEAVIRLQGVLVHFNIIGEVTTRFPNMAGNHQETDDVLSSELTNSGIKPVLMPEIYRESSGEVKTRVIGDLHGWVFTRKWYYWEAKGPGLPPQYAEMLHSLCGAEVRVGGHCGAPSPYEIYNGFAVPVYHIDTQRGLLELAQSLNKCVEDASHEVRQAA